MIKPVHRHRVRRAAAALLTALPVILLLAACGEKTPEATLEAWELPEGKGTRDNTAVCLIPEMSGREVFENELAVIDCSNASEGYIYVRYQGENPKVKLQMTGPDDVLYTYDLDSAGRADVFPLSAGNGTYVINVFENVKQKQYSLALSAEIDVTLRDPFLPFLYPNQYVVFDGNTEAVQLGETLAAPANEDLDVVSNVYNYIIRHVTYDMEKAETVPYGYLPSVDETLSTGKGICLDYASLMTAILRSQQIPTRMEIGYAGQAYHAWLSSYIKDVGWVNGLIEFDGEHWSLMDPTFAASNSSDFLESFIGEGDNYVLKFIY
ncbi:MAG: transglutaminase domain-containing protein [Lachnospiraceae bacterium]|nr:transglutaminase domain-containing protein [Lachnospiraceae bacterium]